jgi:tRNA-splicing ligase RtcB
MFIIYDPKKQRVPIKVWLENIVQLEYGCLKQATNLSTLPFVNKWVALMPDTHQGYGMPIGGVIAVEDAIIPNAVGVDIGCGMAFVETNINKNELSTQEYQALIGRIMRDIPTGFDHHAKKQKCTVLEQSEFAKAQKQKTLPSIYPLATFFRWGIQVLRSQGRCRWHNALVLTGRHHVL